MLRLEVIGNLGANAEFKSENGQEYLTFRVAHSDRYTDAQGQEHSNTTWITCFYRGRAQNLLPYLVKGTKVFCRGNLSMRIYDSAVDHCKKVGVTLSVAEIELCGSSAAPADKVPATLYDDNGEAHEVVKAFMTKNKTNKSLILKSQQGEQFTVNNKGLITPFADEQPL